jgi:uncharacterized protein YraI
MMKVRTLAVAAGTLFAMSSAALADMPVIATADVDLHAGPSVDYEVVGGIDVNGEAMLSGCLEGTNWCEVSYAGMRGWAFSEYLIGMEDGVEIPIAELGAPLIIYEEPLQDMSVGSVVREFIAPNGEIRTYIETHSVEPVYIEDQIAVGSTLPDSVEIYSVPDYDYRYVYVNDRRVLVEPDTRRVVYIVE